MAAGSATQSTLGNTSNLKGKLSSLEVSPHHPQPPAAKYSHANPIGFRLFDKIGHDSPASRGAQLPQARGLSASQREGHAGERVDSQDSRGAQGADQRELQGGGRNETALRSLES